MTNVTAGLREGVARPRCSAGVLAIEEAMSIKFNTKVYELQRAGHQIQVLSLGEAFFDLPPIDVSDLPYPASFHYSDSRGIPELRFAIAAYYASSYGLPVDADREIVLTAGSKAAIYMGLLAAVDAGDEVIIPEPAWVSYTEQVRLCRAVPIGLPHDVGIHEWERYFTPRTRALIVNNPHNPTGYTYSDQELRYIVELARRYGLWLFSDEAYSDFTRSGSFRSTGHFDPEKHNVIVFNSLSKNFGISGWRLGYSIANALVTDQILKVNQHLVTCPPTILEYYLARHFNDILDIAKPQIRVLLEKRSAIAEFMSEIGLRYMVGDGAFYLFVSIAPSRMGSEEFCMRLLEDDLICAVPGIGYGSSCDAFIRVSVGAEPVDAIKAALVTIKGKVVSTSA
jgi:aminotransferase